MTTTMSCQRVHSTPNFIFQSVQHVTGTYMRFGKITHDSMGEDNYMLKFLDEESSCIA